MFFVMWQSWTQMVEVVSVCVCGGVIILCTRELLFKNISTIKASNTTDHKRPRTMTTGYRIYFRFLSGGKEEDPHPDIYWSNDGVSDKALRCTYKFDKCTFMRYVYQRPLHRRSWSRQERLCGRPAAVQGICPSHAAPSLTALCLPCTKPPSCLSHFSYQEAELQKQKSKVSTFKGFLGTLG